MDSSQTLTTPPSSSFSNFQPSHPLSLHYPVDSPKSLLISKSNRQQSPLQPLHLNPSPKPSLTPTSTFPKTHNASPATSASQLPPTYSSPSAKSVQFPFHVSDLGQKTVQNSSQSASKTQNFKVSPSKEFENDHGSKFSLCSKSSCGDGCSGANCEQNALNVHKGRRDDSKDFLKENLKVPVGHQAEKFITQPRNLEKGLVHLNNPFIKAHSMENGISSSKLQAADRALHGLFDMDHHRFGHERMLSEKMGDEVSNGSTLEDSSVGRLRACSVGEGSLEGLEMPKTQVLGPKCQNFPQESMKIKMPFGEQDFGAGRKKVRQCLNILCFTDPKDPSLWSKQKVMNSTICKACFDAFKRGQYCFFCYQIYLDQETSASNDGKDWIECDGCNRWNHIECEAVHGLKDIRNLLQGHENTYSYYCPVCRDDKAAKAISRKMKTLMRSPLMVQSVLSQHKLQQQQQHQQQQQQQQQQLTIKKQPSRPQQGQVTPTVSQKSMVEETMEAEEMIEEPFGKKVKLNTELATPVVPIVDNSSGKVKEKESLEFLSPLDLAKRKLDSVFLKNNANKKRIPKPEIIHFVGHHFPTFNDIEKLMALYSGKRIQLSDNEIRSDLDLFRELSKSSTCHSEDKSNASEAGMELQMELSDEKNRVEGLEDLNGMSRESRMRLKIQKRLLKSRAKEISYSEDNLRDNEEIREEGDSKDLSDNFESKRQLRSRKRLE